MAVVERADWSLYERKVRRQGEDPVGSEVALGRAEVTCRGAGAHADDRSMVDGDRWADHGRTAVGLSGAGICRLRTSIVSAGDSGSSNDRTVLCPRAGRRRDSGHGRRRRSRQGRRDAHHGTGTDPGPRVSDRDPTRHRSKRAIRHRLRRQR